MQKHYKVLYEDSVYNLYDSTNNGALMADKVKSFADLVGFETDSKRLGQLKESLTVYEAIVAVPYIIEQEYTNTGRGGQRSSNTPDSQRNKNFISIPQERYEAALESAIGTETGDSLDAAGQSIRRQVELMEKYIFPPEN